MQAFRNTLVDTELPIFPEDTEPNIFFYSR